MDFKVSIAIRTLVSYADPNVRNTHTFRSGYEINATAHVLYLHQLLTLLYPAAVSFCDGADIVAGDSSAAYYGSFWSRWWTELCKHAHQEERLRGRQQCSPTSVYEYIVNW